MTTFDTSDSLKLPHNMIQPRAPQHLQAALRKQQRSLVNASRVQENNNYRFYYLIFLVCLFNKIISFCLCASDVAKPFETHQKMYVATIIGIFQHLRVSEYVFPPQLYVNPPVRVSLSEK